MARWNGTAWSAVGSGIAPITPVTSLSVVNALALDGTGNLYVGGDFAAAGLVAASNVAKWDGTAWTALGTGTNATVLALASTSGGVYAGGDFRAVGDGSKAMNYLGYYLNTVATAAAATRSAIAIGLFPNPAHATATVQLPAVAGASQATLTLLDVTGRTMRTQRVNLATGGATVTISLTGIAPGLYRLRVQAGNQQASRALLVE